MRRTTSNMIWGLLTGAIVGAASALLLAPRSGPETRKRLKEQADMTREKAKEARGRMGERMTEMKGKAQEMREKMGGKVSEARERAQAVGARVSEKASQAREQAQGMGKIDLNNASRDDLMQIEGIGPASADDIIRYREEHDGFKSVDELDNVYGFTTTETSKVKERFSV